MGSFRAPSGAQVRQLEDPNRRVEPAGNKPGGLVIDIEMQLRGPLAEAVIVEAKKRGVDPAAMVADVLEIVIGDNLWAAVLE